VKINQKVFYKDVDYFLSRTNRESELILDPFVGSGTTGRVCDKLGRYFVGYDLKRY